MRDYSDISNTKYIYNKSATIYADKFMNYAPYQKIMSRFKTTYIQEKSTILDAGCGPGNNCKLFHSDNSHCHITGIDISQAMLEIARKNCPSCHFIEGDIRNIYDAHDNNRYDQTNKRYDVVIASFCIVHFNDEDSRLAIQQLAKALSTHGYLYLSFMEGKTPGEETTSFSKEKLFYNYFDRHWIIELLMQNSISCAELISQDYPEPDGSTTRDIFIFGHKT